MKLKGNWEEQIGTNYSVESVEGGGGKHEINVGALEKREEERAGRVTRNRINPGSGKKLSLCCLVSSVCLSGGSGRRWGY